MFPLDTLSFLLSFLLFLCVELFLGISGDELLVFESDLLGVAQSGEESLDQEHAADALLV